MPVKKTFTPYATAQKLALEKGITTAKEYYNQKQWCKDNNLPSNPARSYLGEGWVNWGTFLQTGNYWKRRTHKNTFNKEQFLSWCTSESIYNSAQFMHCYNVRKALDDRCPTDPVKYYGCKNWADLFGYKKTSRAATDHRNVVIYGFPKRLKDMGAKPIKGMMNRLKSVATDRETCLKAGLNVHVDHIDPIAGDLVCGLHCPDNLCLLFGADNAAKTNKFTPYRVDFQTGVIYWLKGDQWTTKRPFNYVWSVTVDNVEYGQKREYISPLEVALLKDQQIAIIPDDYENYFNDGVGLHAGTRKVKVKFHTRKVKRNTKAKMQISRNLLAIDLFLALSPAPDTHRPLTLADYEHRYPDLSFEAICSLMRGTNGSIQIPRDPEKYEQSLIVALPRLSADQIVTLEAP